VGLHFGYLTSGHDGDVLEVLGTSHSVGGRDDADGFNTQNVAHSGGALVNFNFFAHLLVVDRLNGFEALVHGRRFKLESLGTTTSGGSLDAHLLDVSDGLFFAFGVHLPVLEE